MNESSSIEIREGEKAIHQVGGLILESQSGEGVWISS